MYNCSRFACMQLVNLVLIVGETGISFDTVPFNSKFSLYSVQYAVLYVLNSVRYTTRLRTVVRCPTVRLHTSKLWLSTLVNSPKSLPDTSVHSNVFRFSSFHDFFFFFFCLYTYTFSTKSDSRSTIVNTFNHNQYDKSINFQ